ncbi:phosphotriesterase [candidate division KSB1 bacterium]
MNRRKFIRSVSAGAAGLVLAPNSSRAALPERTPRIQTVTGAISPDDMGLTLPHEHVMVDFVGADKVNRFRYDADEVVATMLPYLKEIKRLGVRTFVDCTPDYLGRDPEILARLSRATGLNIITNTGWYKEPYLPKEAWTISVNKLAAGWIAEIEEGIGNTGIKAGFVKIAVNPGPLIPVQRKIVTAAARTSVVTGAVIASHTVSGVAALEQLDIIEREGVDPGSFIYVHADGEPDWKYHLETAKRGAWVEFDSIGPGSATKRLEMIMQMLDQGYEDNLLLSQDAGWYNVGEPGGGNIRGFAYMVEEFIPALRAAGVNQKLIDKLTVVNPARAFTISRDFG